MSLSVQMDEQRKEMKGPTFNMDSMNKLTNMIPNNPPREELRAKMREKLGEMSHNRKGYHAQSVSQVKKEKWEEAREEESLVQQQEEDEKLERKREKNRQKKKKKREREKANKVEEQGLNIIAQ